MDDTKQVYELQQLETIETDRQYRVIRFSPDGRRLFGAAYDGTIARWDLSGETPQSLAAVEGHCDCLRPGTSCCCRPTPGGSFAHGIWPRKRRR